MVSLLFLFVSSTGFASLVFIAGGIGFKEVEAEEIDGAYVAAIK